MVALVVIPDSVRELCDRCFYGCKHLHHVQFGPSSSVERIGVEWITGTEVHEVNIPDGVREVCGRCFFECKSLARVTFGSSSAVTRIGVEAFTKTLEKGSSDRHPWASKPKPDAPCEYTIFAVHIPDNVRELCDRCFYGCTGLRRVTFGPSSSVERLGVQWITYTHISEVAIPDSVREICDRCFFGCRHLNRITFSPSSSVERIGVEAFSGPEGLGEGSCELSSVHVPDSVRELCDRCFYGCRFLSFVTFGPSSSLERIGAEAFKWTLFGVTDQEILTTV